MKELTIKAKVESKNLSIEEAIDFLEIDLDQINYKVEPNESKPEIQILIDYYTANPKELKKPNQILYLTFKEILPFELEKKDYELLIEHIVTREMELNGEIRKIKFNKQIGPSMKEYAVGLRVEEKSKKENKNKCKENNEFILVKGFHTTTNYGKVSSADIPQYVLAVTPKKLDCRIINKLLLKGDNVTYICFSDIIYQKFTEILKSDEFISLPQIDFSEYVNELESIARNQLFRKICSGEHPLDIIQELENLRKGIYRGTAQLWNVIENILGNIAKNKGYTGDSLGKYLEHLSLNNSQRRLFEETKCLVKALDRNNQAHGKLVRSNSDQKYLAILCLKAIRDIYLNWCFFESLDKCFIEMKSDLNTSIEELWKIFYEKNKQKKITVAGYSGEWDSDMQMKIIFEDFVTKESKDYIFNINLVKESINYQMEVLP